VLTARLRSFLDQSDSSQTLRGEVVAVRVFYRVDATWYDGEGPKRAFDGCVGP